jgi:hypothetical protein
MDMRTAQLKVALSPHAREVLLWRADAEAQPPARLARVLLERALAETLDDPATRRAWNMRERGRTLALAGRALADEPPTAAELAYCARRLELVREALATTAIRERGEITAVVKTLELLAQAAGAADLEDLDAAAAEDATESALHPLSTRIAAAQPEESPL